MEALRACVMDSLENGCGNADVGRSAPSIFLLILTSGGWWWGCARGIAVFLETPASLGGPMKPVVLKHPSSHGKLEIM